MKNNDSIRKEKQKVNKESNKKIRKPLDEKKNFYKKIKGKIVEFRNNDNIEYYNNLEKKHYDWIDVGKAIAMFFIYIGHWNSERISAFAYVFHLQLFFIASGFFALHMQKDSFHQMLKKIFKRIIIPLFLWATISYVVINLDTSSNALDGLIDLLTKPGGVQPNYWFLPSLMVCSIVYWLLVKAIKRPWIILIIAYFIYIFLGERAFITIPFNYKHYLQMLPLSNWYDISAFFSYGLWYALGAASLPIFVQFIEGIDSTNKKHRYISNIIGLGSTAIAIIILLHRSHFDIIDKVPFLRTNYSIVSALIIIISVFYLSYFLRESKYLNKIGKNTMIYIGMEFILHSYIAISICNSLNLGFYSFKDSLSLITYNLLTMGIIMLFIDPINKYFPILNGKERKSNY